MAPSLCSPNSTNRALLHALNILIREKQRASEMASSSKYLQAPTLLLVAALLFLVCVARAQAARPEPRAKDHMPQAEV